MYDADAFLRLEFGTASDVQAQCRAARLPVPQTATVYKWYSRKSLPADWMMVLLAAKERRGNPVRVSRYLTCQDVFA